MARFVYWPSGQQIPKHELSVPSGSVATVSNVAVAECGDDLYVHLVNAEGWQAPGSATLMEAQRKGSVVPVVLKNVREGDQVQVLHKVTNNAWSTPLIIKIKSAPAADNTKAEIRKAIVDLARSFVSDAHYLWGTAGNVPDQANGNPGGGKVKAASLRAASLDVNEQDRNKVLGVCMAVQPNFDGYNTCAGRSSRYINADLNAYLEARKADIAAGRNDQKLWPGAPPKNLHPRKCHFRGTIQNSGQVVWGESCVGVRHFDCVGLVNYCFAQHWYKPDFGLDIAAFRNSNQGTAQVTSANDRMDADILIKTDNTHIAMLYKNDDAWRVVQAADTKTGLSDTEPFDPAAWDRFRMNGAYLR
jgi:hypothetical protein